MTLLKPLTRFTAAALCAVLFVLCACLPPLAVAQTDKKISYAVAVPGARAAAASSAASAPVVHAPTPIIRPLDAAATPPVRAKTPIKPAPAKPAPVKPTAIQKPAANAKSKATASKPKPLAKPAAKPSTATKTTKPAPLKTTRTKPVAKKPAVAKPVVKNQTAKKVAEKLPAAAKVTAVKPKLAAAPTYPEPTYPQATQPEPKSSEPKYPEPSYSKPITTKPSYPEPNAPEPSTSKPSHNLAAGAAVAAVAASALVSAEEEQELARSLAEEGDYLNDPDSSAEPAAAPMTTAPITTTITAPAAAPSTTVPTSRAPLATTALPMSNQREAFVSAFKQFVETTIVPKTPGLALAIIADGKVKVLQTYGVKQAGSNGAINADTTFRLASVSKSFGATAAAMMVNEGLIRWDTPVTSLLPTVEFSNPRYGDQLTVQHILSQATGLPTQTNSNFIEEGLSFDEVVYRLRYVNFVCPPGKCYNYQNVTYSLISNIVRKKTGMSYEQYLENKLFRPLGMRTATVGFSGYSSGGNYAVPHLPTRKGWAPTSVTEHYYRVNPAAGVNASITDMSRWVLAHMGQNPNVLPPAILNAVHAKITRNTPAQNHYGSREGVTDSHYGLGWRVFDYRGDKNFIHHGGGVKGFRSEVVFNPELKIGMVILTNGPRLSGSVIFEFLDAYEDEKRGERRPVAAPVKPKKRN